MIDGDGHIRIRKQRTCLIRVTSGKEQTSLKEAIKYMLHCGVSITHRHGISVLDGRVIKGQWYDLEFIVSRKTQYFIEKFVLPEMTIKHKIERLSGFLN